MKRVLVVSLLSACMGLGSMCLGDELKVGDTVWAQWRPNAWYRGKAVKTCAVGFHVTFDDGDRADLAPALIIVDRVPPVGKVKIGTRVLAPWTDNKMYPGTVVATKEGKYKIKFDDGDSGLVALKDLRVRTAISSAAPAAKVGDTVWAQWKANAWYHGKVAKKCDVGFHVVFDDGDKADVAPSLIIVDRAPAADKVKVGVRVLALWTDGRMYPGTVIAIEEGKYRIKFDDGDGRAVARNNLRLLGE